ncbi:unnamed protein product [Dovyalis caffra]|uniref:Uncharacterized protein n=1 Tax=Dovyalis caffra TaxID=77055 RepID=A0AAV1QUM6_9ROSI|nr:unnamed protein product [Dovyalis caffra]
MGSSIILLHQAGTRGIVSSQAVFVRLNERFEVLREIDWDALNKNQPPLEPAAAISANLESIVLIGDFELYSLGA